MRVNFSRLQIVPSTQHYYAEGLAFVYRDSHKVLCTIGRIRRDTLKQMDCKQEVFHADIDWSLLLKSYPTKEVLYAEIPKYPEVRRDLALILDKMGIAVRSGQMCAEPVMDRFGVTGMLRASFAPYNTMEEAEYFIKCLDRAIKMLV